MMDVGRLAMKIAGKEAGKIVAVVDVLDEGFVLVDGQVKRRRCNINHLEPLQKEIEIKKNASHAEVVKELKKLGIEVIEKKPKAAVQRPIKVRGKKKEVVEEKKEVKKEKKEGAEEKKVKKGASKKPRAAKKGK